MASTQRSYRSFIAKITLASVDFCLFLAGPFVASLIVYLLWHDLSAYVPSDEVKSRLTAHILLAITCVAWFWFRLRHYAYRKPFWFELKEILRTIVIFAIIDLAIVAFSKWHLSRYIWAFTWASVLILMPLGRHLAKKALQKLHLWDKPCVIVGCGENAKEAYHALTSERNLGFNIHHFFATGPNHPNSLFDIPVINDESQLWKKIDPKHTQFFIALEFDEEKQREYWLKTLAVHSCRAVSVIPTTRGIPLNSTNMSFIFSHEVMILQVNNNLSKFSARFLKRCFDLFGSLLLLTLSSPLLIGLGLLTMRDGGSPIYGHERIGKNGIKFRCLKFRSMVLNSEEILSQLLQSDPRAREEWQKDFKLKDDPRITKLGRFIRKTSLDELPQLWNVVRGEMSLVGPRPVIQEELLRYGEDVDYYLMAKPGMTGLWQVSGRNDVDYETRVYFDSWYVKNWSLWNDIAILFKTINVVANRNGAY